MNNNFSQIIGNTYNTKKHFVVSAVGSDTWHTHHTQIHNTTISADLQHNEELSNKITTRTCQLFLII